MEDLGTRDSRGKLLSGSREIITFKIDKSAPPSQVVSIIVDELKSEYGPDPKKFLKSKEIFGRSAYYKYEIIG